ncbi:SDR family oxidoreductase [Piscinibacter koreensis]|uniref:SDR family oxidoreductase n=1 Tax=Piscinibacter koreensis TaxID=2742824 RepID=A0A7Y6NQD5_9BURK|nr:SDR family oxidoreductase [Schlegelella koreensis]NUZ07334.1 SDR family oxidoreductase [Schlegelella koreensis]
MGSTSSRANTGSTKGNGIRPRFERRPVVVILGASSGIGRASAHAFAHAGADVVLAARSAEALEDVARECRELGASASVVRTDATDAAAVRALADTAVLRHGRIDVWINMVGTGAVGRFDRTPIDAHRRVIESNLVGGFNGAHAALPHLRHQRRGTLIQMISVGAWTPLPYATAYTASKFGLHGFVQALRAEVADIPGVHVCAVYPTVVDTPGLSHGANYSGHELQPGGPKLDPREVARAIVRLAREPRPTLTLGASAWPSRIAHALAPNLTARMLRLLLGRSLRKSPPTAATAGNLFAPSVGHGVDGGLRAPSVAASRGAAGGVALLAGGLALGCWLALGGTRGGRGSG